tara:strand:+ start:2774 stop:3784 length:1011 start_codon:yes stop_codon:yes gene_type:complete
MGIFKKIKRGFKKLGSSIAKGMRKIGRGVKKGFKSITKAFGKLGPLGHLALFFILPYAGQALGSWMGQFGSSVMKALPKNFADVLTSVGSKIKTVASIPGKAIGSVYSTVSNALTAGIDYITNGAATNFKNFIGETATNLSATPSVELNLPDKLPDAAPPGIFDEGYKLPKESPPGIFDEGYKLPKGDLPKDLPKIDVEAKDNWIKRYNKFKQDLGKKPIFGSEGGVSYGEALSVGTDATAVFSAYNYFNPDDVDAGFYNPNIGLANALNESTTNPYTVSNQDGSNFVNVNNVPDNFEEQAKVFSNMFGPAGNDPYAAAMNAPGYGFGFEDYITGT